MRWFKETKLGRLKWFGHLFGIQGLYPCRKLVLKAEGTGRVGISKVRWLESVEVLLETMGMRNWGRK